MGEPPGQPKASISLKANAGLAGSVEDPRPFQAVRPYGLRPYTCPAPGSRGTNGGGRCQGGAGPDGGTSASTPFGAPEAVQGAKSAKRSGGGSIELFGAVLDPSRWNILSSGNVYKDL